ncbi:MAG TPA: hypothetical protein VKB46_20930 [Pyrinomonadaceae bacterium]|nr:hypothetical protein [Pyrinomonadaceae bacterium]
MTRRSVVSVFLRRKDGLITGLAPPLRLTLVAVRSPRVVSMGIPIALFYRLNWMNLAFYQLVGITRGKAPHDVEALDCHDSFIVVPLLHLL